jgi:hypothetical protein
MIKKKMNEYFCQSPTIKIKIIENISMGKEKRRECFNFKYYSWKDISDIFQLENNGDINKNYFFIKLYLKLEIFFADSMTINDLKKIEDEYKEKWKNEMLTIDFYNYIPQLGKYYFISIDPKNIPCYINKIFFYISLIIPPLCELYKIYIDSKCYYQTFIIRKVISTSNNLNNDEKYNLIIPGLNYNNELIKYENKENINSKDDLKELIKEKSDEPIYFFLILLMLILLAIKILIFKFIFMLL